MLDRPPVTDEQLSTCARQAYGIDLREITFLPIGYDANAGVFRGAATTGVYFLKVKRTPIDLVSVLLPRDLHARGLTEVVAPVLTVNGENWGVIGEFALLIYPFIETRPATRLNPEQWIVFGATLKRLHQTPLADALHPLMTQETFIPSPRCVQIIHRIESTIRTHSWTHAVKQAFVAFWVEQAAVIQQVVERAEQLGQRLGTTSPAQVICHADIHTGNLLVDTVGGLHIVDWDQPMLAPIERDLLFVTDGVFWTTPEDETQFFRGYGPVTIDPVVMAYYRYTRALEDIAEFAAQILESDSSDEALADAFHWFKAQFGPRSIIAKADQLWEVSLR